MIIREIEENDSKEYLDLCKKLDAESDFLLFEAGERKLTVEKQEKRIKALHKRNNSVIFVVEKDHKLIGYLLASGGQARRNRHSVYIALGILQAYTGQGIGTKLFEELHKWAEVKQISRIELGLMEHNVAALNLYKKVGFKIEGRKVNTFFVNGDYVDEYIMGKILPNNVYG